MSPTELLSLVGWRDIVDILAVAVVVYNLLLLIRGTRAVQTLIGIAFVGLLYFVAEIAELATLKRILESLLIFLPVAAIILFQHEIRRALANFGRNPLWGLQKQQKVESTFSEIVLACTNLSSRRIGSLIVVERLEGLRNFIENGISLDAEVSYNLLINIFSPDTPLHDGAVIVQDDRIAAAACFLPLSFEPGISSDLGTRHRAALGISQETDALAIVVSEETGTISIALGGELTRDLDSKTLRNALYQHLITELYPQGSQSGRKETETETEAA